MNRHLLSNLIALGEGFTTEFKRAMPSDLGREICAFANATGGVILLGVADDGAVCGIAGHNRLKSEIQSIARSAEPSITVDTESIGEVLCVRVPRSTGSPIRLAASISSAKGRHRSRCCGKRFGSFSTPRG